MKLTQEELAEIDRIKAKKLGSECDTFEDLNYCLKLLDKLRPKPDRFTYGWRECKRVHCDKGKVYFNGGWFKCQGCDGLGKVRVKVKSKAHNA